MFVAIGILVISACRDVRMRRIPNVFAAAIAMLGLVRMLTAGDTIGAIHTVAASAVVFAAVFLLFSRGVLGEGDAKLVAAVVLTINYDDLFGFLFLMSLGGGALALAIFARDSLTLLSSRLLRSTGMAVGIGILGSVGTPARSTVPDRVAIAAAEVVTSTLETSSVR
jgi:Flp pilus assembly protein protease CpaA